MSALSLRAADALIDALAGAYVADAARRTNLGLAADIAPLLRGHAREDDGAAFALLTGLGFAAPDIAAALPAARALNAG